MNANECNRKSNDDISRNVPISDLSESEISKSANDDSSNDEKIAEPKNAKGKSFRKFRTPGYAFTTNNSDFK